MVASDGSISWAHGYDASTSPETQYKCTVCQHIYDPQKDGGGLPFEKLPDSFKCPVCGSPKSAFKPMVASDGSIAWAHGYGAATSPQTQYKCTVCQHIYD